MQRAGAWEMCYTEVILKYNLCHQYFWSLFCRFNWCLQFISNQIDEHFYPYVTQKKVYGYCAIYVRNKKANDMLISFNSWTLFHYL